MLYRCAQPCWRRYSGYLTDSPQFIKSRNSEVTETVIRSATNGMKEADTSFLTVLNEIFSPMTRKRAKELGLSEEEEGRYLNRLSRAVEATGSMDKVVQGECTLTCTCEDHS
jgi:chromosome transmission fidelity protein 18